MAADNFMYFTAAATGGQLVGKATQPQGETTDDFFKTKNAFEVREFSFGVENPNTIGSATGGAGGGKAKFNTFTIKKSVDQASAPVYQAMVAGAHFPSIMLICRKSGGQKLPYLQFAFVGVFVTNINWNGGGGEADFEETVVFQYQAMAVQYMQQLASGAVGKKQQAMWSVTTNTPTSTVTGLGTAGAFLDAA